VSGEPIKEIAIDEGVQASVVRKLARRAGIPARPRRRYPIDETVFDHPTELGWWLIGLIAADGCIDASQHRVSLSQRVLDQDVLLALYEFVGSPNRPLTVIRTKSEWSSGGEYREARIFSRRICAALEKHGVGPRKTRSLRFSTEAASQAAVWLGLFDGDGSAGATLNHGIPRIDFVGTPQVMKQCSAFWSIRISLQTRRPPSLVAHGGGLSKVAIYGSNAAVAARILLKASPVSLQRKRRTLEQIAEYERGPHWTKRTKRLRNLA
jgi:hypothetical protein